VTLFRGTPPADTTGMVSITRPSTARVLFAGLAAAVSLASWTASAQSLADVARKEGQRRKDQPAAKVYTNETLRADITPSAPSTPPTAPGAESSSPAGTAAAPSPTPGEDEPKKDEAYWRGRIRAAREQLERSQAFAAALESQINALSIDFINRDDPAQRGGIEANRKKAVAEHERVLREIDGHKKAVTTVEDEARKAGVPPGWLR
jgi:hypothetical protein